MLLVIVIKNKTFPPLFFPSFRIFQKWTKIPTLFLDFTAKNNVMFVYYRQALLTTSPSLTTYSYSVDIFDLAPLVNKNGLLYGHCYQLLYIHILKIFYMSGRAAAATRFDPPFVIPLG